MSVTRRSIRKCPSRSRGWNRACAHAASIVCSLDRARPQPSCRYPGRLRCSGQRAARSAMRGCCSPSRSGSATHKARRPLVQLPRHPLSPTRIPHSRPHPRTAETCRADNTPCTHRHWQGRLRDRIRQHRCWRRSDYRRFRVGCLLPAHAGSRGWFQHRRRSLRGTGRHCCRWACIHVRCRVRQSTHVTSTRGHCDCRKPWLAQSNRGRRSTESQSFRGRTARIPRRRTKCSPSLACRRGCSTRQARIGRRGHCRLAPDTREPPDTPVAHCS